MSRVPGITDAEWEIMKIIWKKDNITANEIIKETESKFSWKANTVKTLINRLLKKNAISFNKNSKEYSYFAAVSEKDCLKEKNHSFLKKAYDGSLNSMVLNFVNADKLTDDELEELKYLLSKAQE